MTISEGSSEQDNYFITYSSGRNYKPQTNYSP